MKLHPDNNNRDTRMISPLALEKLRQTIITCFSQGQFHQVGIREICQQAKVSPQTVYKYFGSKEELMFACIREDMEEMNQRAMVAAREAQGFDAKIRAFCAVFFQFYQDNPAIARIVYVNIPLAYWVSNQYFVQRELHQFLYTIVEENQSRGVIGNQAPADVLMDMIMGATSRIIVRWLTQYPDKPLRDFGQHFENSVQYIFNINHEIDT